MNLLFMSGLILNSESHEVKRDLREPYEMHRTLMLGFDDQENHGRILWRSEISELEQHTIYVQSESRPDWSRLPVGYCLPPLAAKIDINPVCRAIPESALQYERGQVRHFRLRANPVKRLAESGKRTGITDPHEQVAWLERKASESGFEIIDVMITRTDRPDCMSKGSKDGKRLSLLSVDFKGRLRVLEPEIFIERAVRSGIGPGKGLGMGMLI